MVVLLLLILSLGCVGQKSSHAGESLDEPSPEYEYREESTGEGTYTEEESLEIAQNYVLNSPTYKFDGLELRYVETNKAQCQYCWVFVFEFTSRHGGYGDRSKQMLTQVMTKHTAKVTVENGKVVAAVLDDVWDMINQEMIESQQESCTEEESLNETYTEEESLDIAREFVLNSPTYKFDGLELRYVETIPGECSYCWVFVFEFTSRHGGYGDRSKQMLTQVMTKHTAKVTVENGKVTSAVLDDVWDMINQEMIA